MLPLRYLKDQLMRKFKNRDLSPEAFSAYFHKLPTKLNVSWEREGKYIVGSINADGNQFYTQALSAEEFVEMVNDAIFAAYAIPIEYSDLLQKAKKFEPPKEEYIKLNDIAIKASSVNFNREVVTA